MTLHVRSLVDVAHTCWIALLVRLEMQRHTSKVLEKEGLKKASTGGDQEEPIELKFRIYDGTDIGYRTYLPSTIVANLKQQLIDEWPQGKSVTPESINHVKLIHGGKVLDNFKSLAESKVAYQGSPRVITMHVVVNTHPEYARAEYARDANWACGCVII